MKRKNGFTLIELLAIIVILAIIAVITVPIILNIIDESSKGAAKDSAHGYTKSLDQYFASTLIEDKDQEFPSGVYHITDEGALQRPSEEQLLYPITSGNQPSAGWIDLEKGIVKSYSLKFGDYVVTKLDDENPIVEKKEYFTPKITIDITPRKPAADNKTAVEIVTEWSLPKDVTNITGGNIRYYVEIGQAEPTKEYIYENGTYSTSSTNALNQKHTFSLTMKPTTAAKRLFAISYVTYTLDGEEYTLLSDVKVSEPES